MPTAVRYRLLVITFMAFELLYRLLCIPVGLLVLSAVGLLLVQQYAMALLMLVTALVSYEAIYYLLIGRWRRHAE